MRSEFCGRYATHDGHRHHRVRWHRRTDRYEITIWTPRRWCSGALTNPCGLGHEHGPHWGGELDDELCRGVGLSAVCPHGEQMLNACDECP